MKGRCVVALLYQTASLSAPIQLHLFVSHNNWTTITVQVVNNTVHQCFYFKYILLILLYFYFTRNIFRLQYFYFYFSKGCEYFKEPQSEQNSEPVWGQSVSQSGLRGTSRTALILFLFLSDISSQPALHLHYSTELDFLTSWVCWHLQNLWLCL